MIQMYSLDKKKEEKTTVCAAYNWLDIAAVVTADP